LHKHFILQHYSIWCERISY